MPRVTSTLVLIRQDGYSGLRKALHATAPCSLRCPKDSRLTVESPSQALWKVLAPGRRLGSRDMVSCSSGPQLTCQDGIHLCHHVSCVVHTEAHWGFKFQNVPPRAICAQQNVVLFQPVSIGHGKALWPSSQGTLHRASKSVLASANQPLGAPPQSRSHRDTALATNSRTACLPVLVHPALRAPVWGALHLALSLPPSIPPLPQAGASSHPALESRPEP